MQATSLVSEQEYLSTEYRPDCDLVDGQLLERNLGQKDHSNLQGELYAWFRQRRQTLKVKAFVEQRIRVGPMRYRIPDVCVVRLPEPDEQVFTDPPYVCIEILSPEDSRLRLQDRFDDYLKMGVENVWAIDPASRRAWRIVKQGHMEALDGELQTADGLVRLPLVDLFEGDDF